MMGISIVHGRKVAANDGRPEGLKREAKRVNGINATGMWFGLALAAQILFFFVWGKQYRIAFEPFWAGLFIIMGSSCLVATVLTRAWPLLGWAIPLLGYGLCLPLAESHGKVNGVLFGMMFIAVALSFSFIAVMQVRMLEHQHDAD